MAYQNHAIGTMTEIPALVATFAAANGWTVSGQTYNAGTGVTFTLSAASDSLTWTPSDSAAPRTFTASPKLNGTAGSPVIPAPTQLHLFASATPAPYLIIVIQYDYNLYRHLYLGNMVKAGSYGGGEVLDAVNTFASNDAFQYPLSYRNRTRNLFNARSRIIGTPNTGGVRVVHDNNPTTWRKFFGTDNFNPMGNFDNATVLGGYGDDVNDGYLARGRSTFSGAQILVPINLYATMPVTGDTTFVPLGHPAGVRLVHMQDIDPGQAITVGGVTWRCFPATRKSTATSVSKSAGGWASDESSYFVGYAYPNA